MEEKGLFVESKSNATDYKKWWKAIKKSWKPDPTFLKELNRLKKIKMPKAGQIWTTKSIPQLNFGGKVLRFLPVVIPRDVYILTNPLPYPGQAGGDDVNYIVNILPITSGYTEFATHEDYIVPGGNDIMGTEFMIEAWLETTILQSSLQHCVGELSPTQIEELLSVYFKSNSLEFDEETYKRARKGKFHDKDYGEIFEFKRLEEENVEYLLEPINALGNWPKSRP